MEKTKVLRREWKTTRERSCDGKHSIMFNSVDVMMSHSKRKATVNKCKTFQIRLADRTLCVCGDADSRQNFSRS